MGFLRSSHTLSSIQKNYGQLFVNQQQQPSSSDNPTCFHLDRICHHGNNDEWFYDDNASGGGGGNSNITSFAAAALRNSKLLYHQPTIAYSDRNVPYIPDKRYYFNVTHRLLHLKEKAIQQQQQQHVPILQLHII